MNPSKTLERVYREHQGKVSDRWALYLREYQRLFEPLREQPLRLLEIGVQNGGSLEVWAEYFPQAVKLVGCDNNPDCAALSFADPRIALVVGDANGVETRQSILGQTDGEGFDVVIDDGSHRSGDIVRSFALYFPCLAETGMFVAEDLHCSYWREFEGGLFDPFSSQAFFKHLADVVNHEHWGIEQARAAFLADFFARYDTEIDEATLAAIHSVEFINSLCVVRKRPPAENQLGLRCVSGAIEAVVAGHRALDGTPLEPMPQSDHAVAPSGVPGGEAVSLLVQRLAARDAEISRQRATLAEQEKESAKLRQILSDLQAKLGPLERTLAEREAEREAVLASNSWRLTAPLRWSGGQVRRATRARRVFSLARRHAGGAGAALRKAFAVWRREGWPGVGARIRFVLDRDLVERRTQVIHRPRVQHETPPLQPHRQDVDIVVCVHNALADVRRCLESVMRHTLPPYQLIIVDDGSDRPTQEFLEQFIVGQPARLIHNATARGYTCAANAGLRASDAPFVILLNSDTVVSSLWLERMLRCAESDERIGLVGPLSNTASWQSVPRLMEGAGEGGREADWALNPLPPDWTVDQYAKEVARAAVPIYPRVGFLNGFCLLLKRTLINDLGLFDEETFGPGYGEENDYCLRAHGGGWELAVADDCYVFHAQSKSYSSERRRELVARSDQALVQKHGARLIGQQLIQTRFHPALNYIRHRCAAIEVLAQRRQEGLRLFEGKRVLFLLPVDCAGGGSNVVLDEAACMREFGVDAWIANLDASRVAFEADHPRLTVPVLYLPSQHRLPQVARDFDAVVATLYLTVSWLLPLAGAIDGPLLGYYVQDFEPDFFAPGSAEREKALASYTLIPSLRLFTKTRWNQAMLAEKLGVQAEVVGPSLDIHSYHPTEMPPSAQVVRVLAMVRPATPRRAPENTMRLLRRLARHFGPRIAIDIMGVGADDVAFLHYRRDFPHRCLGELDKDGVVAALAEADIFVDCSAFQAMGLSAMEAMAAGVAVVGPRNGGLSEIVRDRHNGLLVDTTDLDAVFAAVSELITDRDLLADLRANGFEVVAFSPLLAAFNVLACLFAAQPEAVAEDGAAFEEIA
jgi:GT2 family glycosyltransferase